MALSCRTKWLMACDHDVVDVHEECSQEGRVIRVNGCMETWPCRQLHSHLFCSLCDLCPHRQRVYTNLKVQGATTKALKSLQSGLVLVIIGNGLMDDRCVVRILLVWVSKDWGAMEGWWGGGGGKKGGTELVVVVGGGVGGGGRTGFQC